MNPLGNNGNSADSSQRHAPNFDDESVDVAIQVLRQHYPYGFFWEGENPISVSWKDPDSVERLREWLRKPSSEEPAQVPEEESEKPFDQDKFFNDIEEMRKQIPKRL